jgi:hypothetical protein
VSFASEPGRDDGNLPPVNIVVPDDARELDRDVLAYRREQRARRRRRRILRLFRPFRVRDVGGQAAIIPLIAACLAISLVGGALLSVVTMSPALAPTVSARRSATPSAAPPAALTTPLPAGNIQLDGRTAPVHSMVSSVIALIPVGCRCDAQLSRLSRQAVAAHVRRVYFAGTGSVAAELTGYVRNDGDGLAVTAVDNGNVLGAAYHLGSRLTVLLVYKDATASVYRSLTDSFQLTSAMGELTRAGAGPGPAQTPAR